MKMWRILQNVIKNFDYFSIERKLMLNQSINILCIIEEQEEEDKKNANNICNVLDKHWIC